jgi:ubiquinone/menaquinone biosynthesis C-methylase UbiE
MRTAISTFVESIRRFPDADTFADDMDADFRFVDYEKLTGGKQLIHLVSNLSGWLPRHREPKTQPM